MNVFITLENENKTITVEPASCVINRGICNDSFQHREDTCDVNLIYEPELYAFIVANQELFVTVKKEGGGVLFTGIANADVSWTDEGAPFPIRQLPLTIRDYTSRLDKTSFEEIAYLDVQLSTILAKLAYDCNMSIQLDNIPEVTLQAFVMPSGRNYLKVFDILCYQYGITFYFDQIGRICFFNFCVMPENPEFLSDEVILSGLKTKKSSNRYDAIKITYNSLKFKNNEQIFFESFGYNSDNTPTPAIIQPGVYFPFDSTPVIEETEGQVFQSFASGFAESRRKYNGELEYRRSKDTSLLYTHNHRVVEDWEGHLIIERKEFETLRASVRFKNNGTSDAKLRQFAIRADAVFRDKESNVTVGIISEKTFTTEAEYIYTNATAEKLANALFRYFSKSTFLLTISTDNVFINPGTFRSIDSGKSGFMVDALILSYSLDCDKDLYSYNAVSVGPAAVDVNREKNTNGNDFVPGNQPRLFFTYHASEEEPSLPKGTGDSGGWHYTQTQQSIWQSSKIAISAEAGEWGIPIRIKNTRSDVDVIPFHLKVAPQSIILDCDSDGNIIAGLIPFSIQAVLFKWNREVNDVKGIVRYPGTDGNIFNPMLGDFVVTGRSIKFSLENAPEGVTIDKNGEIYVSKDAALDGYHNITVKAEYNGETHSTIVFIQVRKRVGEARYLGTVNELVQNDPVAFIIKGPIQGSVRALQSNYVFAVKNGTAGALAWRQGYVYQWTGLRWEERDPILNSALYISCFKDGLDVPDLTQNTGWFGALFAKLLVAQNAFIETLEAEIIRLRNPNNKNEYIELNGRYGLMKSSNFTDNGNDGFNIKYNGDAEFRKGTFKGKIVGTDAEFTGNLNANVSMMGGASAPLYGGVREYIQIIGVSTFIKSIGIYTVTRISTGRYRIVFKDNIAGRMAGISYSAESATATLNVVRSGLGITTYVDGYNTTIYATYHDFEIKNSNSVLTDPVYCFILYIA